jgi:hypothetical protein
VIPALVATALLGIAGREYHARRLADRWAAVEITVSELETMQRNIRRFRPWFDGRAPSLNALQDLSAAFPVHGDVWARTVEIDAEEGVTCSGFARTQENAVDMAHRIPESTHAGDVQVKQLRGEDPVQFSVHFAWKDARHE